MTAIAAPQDAIHLLQEHYADLPQPDAALALAAAYQAAGDLPHAVEYNRLVFTGYPASDQASQAATALTNLHDSMGAAFPNATPQQMIARANNLLAAAEYTRARAEFQALIPQLNGAERDQARVGIGIAQFRHGDIAAAYQYLRGLGVTDDEADAQRLEYLVECARRLNDDEELMDAVKKLNKEHAASLWRLKALVTAAGHFLAANQRDKYIPLYKAAYEAFPNNPRAAPCHWRVAWDAYIHRKPEAESLLREHVEHYPDHPSASAALYFLGRLAEADGDNASAHTYYAKVTTLYPNYYYGLLARERLAQPSVSAAAPSAKAAEFLGPIAFPAHKAPAPAQPDEDTAMHIGRARLLESAGLQDLAEAELRFAMHHGSQPYLLALEIARNAGEPYQGLHAMKSAIPEYLSISLDDAPSAFWTSLFPLPYRNDVLRSARQQSLDPYMLAALIRQESEFNPQALSPAHAYGLTQIEPGTGRALARRAGVRRFTNRSLFQPSINLKLGSIYLKALLDQWGGKWEQTLASYNAGKSRVTDWLTWNDYREPAEFVESIPFTETREYVQAILRNASVYRQLYGAKLASAPQSGGGRTFTNGKHSHRSHAAPSA
jgi:soluble lytic murein transglycosylase